MGWLSKKLGKLLLDAVNDTKHSAPLEATIRSSSDHLDIAVNQTQFTVLKCANGKLVKVSEYKPTKSMHPDWQHELYLVKDDEKVPDVIARIMAIKALEQ
jgi:hypothetical protein